MGVAGCFEKDWYRFTPKMVVRALCVIGSRGLIVEVGGFGLKAFGLGGVAGKDQGR